jgi:hypothetical protein
MTESQYDEIAAFARELPQRRTSYPDPQLLDECQKFLDAFVASLADGPFDPPPMPACTVTPYASLNAGTLSCTMGIWTGEPTSYAYQWMRDGIAVGTDSATYPVGTDDHGHSFTCVVTGSNATGQAAAPPSNAVAVG